MAERTLGSFHVIIGIIGERLKSVVDRDFNETYFDNLVSLSLMTTKNSNDYKILTNSHRLNFNYV